ncbi:hypothetical protein [Beggiatoa leptomitoformis]|uniref:Uncharacterized protein n=1 Tax=Beggiatoa leptomitoformis TaxID=288004 RepID=A0A650GRI1_9GAMM|nr:hypothetical protein [Beggiatoa leptomitoformis]QGX03620.1 hypothetical protein AL038_18755 [Beggiatoa leptomitoformis]QGX04067.1 hypothetical protein BLE401_18565 [Beggiatoa leptomitoformis]
MESIKAQNTQTAGLTDLLNFFATSLLAGFASAIVLAGIVLLISSAG